MTVWDRFSNAALDLAAAEQILTDVRRATKRCTERSRGNPSIGDPGCPPCDPVTPEADRCDNCEFRHQNWAKYGAALKSRRLAKARMMRWYPRLKDTLAQVVRS